MIEDIVKAIRNLFAGSTNLPAQCGVWAEIYDKATA